MFFVGSCKVGTESDFDSVAAQVAERLPAVHCPLVGTVLVIDDDPVISDLVRMVLEDAGFVVTTASALADVPKGIDADCIIADLVGLAVYSTDEARRSLAAVRKRFPARPVIVVTAHAAAARDRNILGVTGVIVKPFDMDELVSSVRRATKAD